jgi:hypothetical protein
VRWQFGAVVDLRRLHTAQGNCTAPIRFLELRIYTYRYGARKVTDVSGPAR